MQIFGDSIDYDKLKKDYNGFKNPHVVIMVNKKDLVDKNKTLSISQVSVDMSSGFEASVASFRIYGMYDRDKGVFNTSKHEKYLYIGSQIEIDLGYSTAAIPVFVGFISKINFVFEDPEIPYVVVTAMDAKGIMMANNSSRQLMATTIDKAVSEIFNGPTYASLTALGIITGLKIETTPDAGIPTEIGAAPPTPPTPPLEKPTIEMVGESDYEFVVRMAKKVNFEFFIAAGTVIFRPAKVYTDTLMTITPGNILRSFDIEYDITGQVGKVEVRATDTDKGDLITASSKVSNEWSFGSKAAKLVKNNKMVYLDPSVHTQSEAQNRMNYLIENISYKFGKISCETLGIPALAPGRFIEIEGIGEGASNIFYMNKVRHVMTRKGEYKCVIEGKAKDIRPQELIPDLTGLF
ncbi:MAG: hypothetical protein K6E95_03765 [Lachnospiraceae bacterium]|nr:hypothetical protein [Lachnospiraceae bacterium]